MFALGNRKKNHGFLIKLICFYENALIPVHIYRIQFYSSVGAWIDQSWLVLEEKQRKAQNISHSPTSRLLAISQPC